MYRTPWSFAMVAFICFQSIREVAGGSIFEQTNKGRCTPITIPLCKDIPYNNTIFPNTFLQLDQESLKTQTEHFKPLIKTKCHTHIKFFVCSVFAPMCPDLVPQAVTSCRSVCEEVKADCKSILDEFGIGWPEPLECSRFPEEPSLCMKPTDDHRSTQSRPSLPNPRLPTLSPLSCPPDLLNVDPSHPEGACAPQCDAEFMFKKQDKNTASAWMLIFASANLVISAFTFFTFLVDRQRFRFPERCVLFMCFSFAVYSLPYLFPLIWTFEERACNTIPTGQAYLVYSGFDNSRCLLSFTLTYYFSSAASLWWLMFAFTCYLSAARKWVPEGVDSCSSYVHLLAWGVSALLTTVVLVSHKIDASELTGVCSVGNTDPYTLLYFSILPRALITVIGVFFIVAGLSSMCKEGRSFRKRGTDTSKLEKLMAKMCLFCVLYLVPAIFLLACDYMHFVELHGWTRATIQCKSFGGVEAGGCVRPKQPQAVRYLFALAMSLSGGIACSVWIISPKTWLGWQRFLCCGLCSSAPQKPSPTVTRPLLEPPVPVAPPPQPPTHYGQLSSQHGIWRPSNVV